MGWHGEHRFIAMGEVHRHRMAGSCSRCTRGTTDQCETLRWAHMVLDAPAHPTSPECPSCRTQDRVWGGSVMDGVPDRPNDSND